MPAAGPPRSRGSAGRQLPAAVAGLLVGSALGATIFLLAVFLHDRLFSPVPSSPPAGSVPAGDPRAAVRVYAGSPREGVDLVLLPLREDGVPAPGAEGVLDAELFPGGPAHRWYRLLATNRDGDAPLRVTLGEGHVTREAPDGLRPSADLRAAWSARERDLAPHRRMALRLLHVPESSVEVSPRGSVRILVAVPAGGPGGAEATGFRMADGTRLWPVDVTVESLRAALGAGDGRRLEPAHRAEARGPGAAR